MINLIFCAIVKVGKKKCVDLFEKYLIINIDNIQRKYAIRSRYGINKNLTTGPDLQNIIKSDNDKGVTSHTLYSYQYFANKVHRVDHIFLFSYTSFSFFFYLLFYRFPLISLASSLLHQTLGPHLIARGGVGEEGSMRRKSARRHREISTAFLFVDFFFFLFFYICERSGKNGWQFLTVFLSDLNVTGPFFLHLSFCLRATL